MGIIPENRRLAVADPTVGEAVGDDTSVSDYLQIRDYTRIVYRRRWMIVGILGAGVLCGALINWMTVPIFMAQATLQIDTDLNVLGVDRPLLPVDQRDWMREFLPTQLGILESRELARLAHEQLKHSDRSGPSGIADAVKLDGRSTSTSPDGGDRRVPTVGEIVEGRSVSLGRESRLVNIAFRSSDPGWAAAVANALAQGYVQQNLEFRSKASGDASDWLLKQVEQQRKLVAESEAALQRYRKDEGADALFTDKLGVEQQNVVVQKLAALQAAVTKARTETIEKEALNNQLSATQARGEPLDTVPAIASNTYIQGLKSEVTALQRQLAQASNELGERHPEFIKLQEAAQNAERKLQLEISNVVGAIRNDFESTRSRERALVAALERQKLEARILNGKAVEYTALEREATSNREVLDKLLQRSREASLARELQSTSIRIVDWAEVPRVPVLPRQARTLAFAVLASGALALALAFLLEPFNTRMMSPEDVKRHLRLPVFGGIPQVKPQSGHASLILGDGEPLRFAELFQGLRTNLVSTAALAAGRILLVTSSEPAEGKTLTAANLAVSLARLKQRVLLIDADMRNPRLHEVFGEDQQPGLADLLSGKTPTRDFRKTRVSGLWLMPAGSASQDPADLLGSESFDKLIDNLRRHFDWIVLDSPPVLAVTDPSLIARVASGVLLVVDSQHTPREVALAAVKRLEVVGANVVAAMLNRVVLDRRGNSYVQYYRRDYTTASPEHEDSFRPPDLANESVAVANQTDEWVEQVRAAKRTRFSKERRQPADHLSQFSETTSQPDAATAEDRADHSRQGAQSEKTAGGAGAGSIVQR